MSLKQFRQNILLAALLMFVYLMLRKSFPVLSLILIFSVFVSKTDLKSTFILILLCLFLLIDPYRKDLPETDTYWISEIHQNYAVAQSGRNKIMLYTTGPSAIDTMIRLKPSFQKISHHKSFFGFDFGTYMQRKGVYWQFNGDAYETINEIPTPRRWLQKKTDEIADPLLKAFVYRVVFNCMNDEFLIGSFLQNGGFSLAGVLMIIETLLKFIMDEKRRAKTMVFMTVLFIILYGFQIILISSLIRRILRMTKTDRAERCGFWSLLMMLLFREQVLGAAFLIPLCFTICSLYETDQIWIRYSLLCAVQSILFQRINPFDTLFYPFLIRIYAMLWFYGILCIFIPGIGYEAMIMFLSRFSLITEKFCLPGSIIGAGMPFFLIWILSFYRHEHFAKITFCSLIVFLACGLFHPFAEVCFINVGQGDCILIKGPFLLDQVLIDTGKPSQYGHVLSALHARGIRHLNTLFITHMDSDHCGNMEQVIDDFKVSNTVDEHQGTTYSSLYEFHDLNSIVSEDKNQSSLVLAFTLNGLDFIMTGDADMKAEEMIAARYPGLQCDVLKLSHHGSKTGSCDRFLDLLQPKIGIISSGAYSIYHHPSPETIQRLLKRHIPYLDTKEHGDISILMIGPLRVLITSDGFVDLL